MRAKSLLIRFSSTWARQRQVRRRSLSLFRPLQERLRAAQILWAKDSPQYCRMQEGRGYRNMMNGSMHNSAEIIDRQGAWRYSLSKITVPFPQSRAHSTHYRVFAGSSDHRSWKTSRPCARRTRR